jgi:hypothetical protein
MEQAQAAMEDADLGDLAGYIPEGAMEDWGEQAANFTTQAEERFGDQAAGLLNSTMGSQFDELAGGAWS